MLLPNVRGDRLSPSSSSDHAAAAAARAALRLHPLAAAARLGASPAAQAPQVAARETPLACRLAALAGVVTAGFMAPAFAQSTGAAAALPEIRVSAESDPAALPPTLGNGQTARGGRLGLLGNADTMDTPFSAASYTSQMVQDQQAVTIADIVKNDASVRLSGHGGDQLDSFFIRGFPVGDQNSGEIAFDGVYGIAPNYRVLADYAERIEIIKGPAALLYGMSPASSVGGAINIVPKRAGSEPLTRLSADYGAGSQGGAQLDVSRRFGAQREWGVRFNGSHHQGDTLLDNQARKADVGALALDYQGERLRATLDAIVQNENVDAPQRRPFLAAGATAVPAAPDGRRNVSQPWEWFETTDRSVLLQLEYDLSDHATAFAHAGSGRTRVDRLFGNPTLLNLRGDTSTLPQRFRFDVDRNTADAGLRTRFTTGTVRHAVTLQASIYEDRLGRASANGTAVLSNIYTPITRPAQSVDTPAVARVADTQLTSVALADQLSMLDDRVQVLAGVRHQRVQADNFSATTGAIASSYDQSAVTPLLGLVVKPAQNVSLYANYIGGLSKGDMAPSTAANAGEVFAPYKTKQKEIGAKLEWNRMVTSVSVFEITKPSGQQTNGWFAVDAEQRNRGLELSTSGRVAPGVSLTGGVTLLQGVLSQTNSSATLGKKAIGVPSVQANLAVEWDLPWVPGLALSGAITHTGRQYVDRANTLGIPAWTTADLGARYRTQIGGKATTFRASLRNVADRAYWAGVSQYGSLVQGAPRSFVVSATVDF